MTAQIPVTTATMHVPGGFVDVPAHDVQHEAQGHWGTATTVYTQNFDALTAYSYNPDGWGDGGTTTLQVYPFNPRSAPHVLFHWYSSTAPVSRTFTGLTVGNLYTLRMWARPNTTLDITLTCAGETRPHNNLTGGQWWELGISFVATASSHTLSIQKSMGQSVVYDDVTLTSAPWVVDVPAYTEHVPDHIAYEAALEVITGKLTLDEGWAPYAQATLAVYASEVVIEQMDPRDNIRVTLEASYQELEKAPVALTAELVLGGRELTHEEGVVIIDLYSQERLLQKLSNNTASSDLTPLGLQTSMRSICNWALGKIGASLAAGTVDADFTTLQAATNQVTNPSASVDLTDATSQNLASLVRQTGTTWGAHGTAFRLNGGTASNDSWMNIGGDTGGLRLGMQAGGTYTASGIFHIDSALGGTSFAGRARSIVVIVVAPSWNGGAAGVFSASAAAPNVAGTTARLSLTFTLPKDTTSASIRWYHGHNAASTAYWSDLMLLAGNGIDTDRSTPIPFFDGNTADGTPGTASYSYNWTATAGKSTSTRTPLIDRSPDTLTWEPQESLWDFLRGPLETSGLRLFCDEAGVWRLVDNQYSVPGRVTLAQGYNVYQAKDSIDLDSRAADGSPTWFDGVNLKYVWLDSNAVRQEAYDVAGPANPIQPYNATIEKAYPGPGRAAYILSRVNGQGRTLDITARPDLSVRPGQEAVASLPFTPAQTGYTSSVSWNFEDHTMSVGTRGLVDTPDTAYIFGPEGVSYNDIPAGVSYNNFNWKDYD
ncbi:hypothetical protein DOE76_13950 [Leifsonia sp. ku-ls]|nr:hypothetical protein DOE76_13950 [Leifsonia sp. ku-ls]